MIDPVGNSMIDPLGNYVIVDNPRQQEPKLIALAERMGRGKRTAIAG
ncbi:MAG: hypothetical protein K6U89_14055 [Chloroflexi bacterium]|nr:hypothetical protein [Chloroflexota bacterium]